MKHVTVMRAMMAVGFSLPLLASSGSAAELPVRQQGQVAYVSGGIGETELAEVVRLTPEYPLELLFAASGTPTNKYLADVKVQIKDKDGKVVLDAHSQGPFLLVKLAPGKYLISADSDGEMKQQSVQLRGTRTQRVVFVWRGQPMD